MSIKAMPMYYAECDACGLNITQASQEYVAWAESTTAFDEVNDGEGVAAVYGDSEQVVVCRSCASAHMADLPDEDWDALYDRTDEALRRLKEWVVRRGARTA